MAGSALAAGDEEALAADREIERAVDDWKPPWVNCWVMLFRRVPWPARLPDCSGAAEIRSPNSALLFLKPIEPTLATLFEITERSVCAPLRPESEV